MTEAKAATAVNATLELTPEVIRADGQNRIAKTAGQTGVSGAVVTVALFVAHQVGYHGDVPPEVVSAAIILLSTAAAVLTNRGRLAGRG